MKNLETIDSKLKMNIQLLASEGEDKSQDTDNKDVNLDSQKDEQLQEKEKTFTQEDLDKILSKQFAKWKAREEKEKREAIKAKELEQMSEEDRTRKKMEELQNEVETMKAEREKEALTNSTLKELSVRGFDAECLQFVIAEDVDSTKSKLDAFETKINSLVDSRVEATISERMKGKTPVTSTKIENKELSPFELAFKG